ncbi:MAG: hypothetical protein QJR00_01460 [Bacillota bacterium]|nr:hypothetical protein [Bacillota bacterium]
MKKEDLIGLFSYRCLESSPDFKAFIEHHGVRGRVKDHAGGKPNTLAVTTQSLHLFAVAPAAMGSRLFRKESPGDAVYWKTVRETDFRVRED